MWLSQSINCLVNKKSENIEKYASQYHKAQSDIFVLLFFFLSDQESSIDVIYVTYFEKGAEVIIFFFSLFLFDHVLEVEIKVIENTNHAKKSSQCLYD